LARVYDEWQLGCDSDEIADRRAAPPLLNLFGCSLACPAAWLVARIAVA
jgi:hypothetical protein